jgi:cytochrome c peroxidase
MKPSRQRVLLIAAVVVAGGLLAFTLAGRHGSTAAASTDPHADPHIPKAQMAEILNAVSAVTSSKSQAELVAQGRALFRDPTVARQGESCQSCHTEATANAPLGSTAHKMDPAQPLSASNFDGLRDPPNLVNAGSTAPYGWIGSAATLNAMVVGTIKTHFADGARQPDATTAAQAAELVAYISQLKAPRTTFDEGTTTAQQQRGLRLFQTKGGCIACHGGPDFTDNKLHATCVPQVPGGNDPGFTPPDFDCSTIGKPGLGSFNTPQLRDLVASAPYMHNGVFTTLKDVVDFYNTDSSISPLNLTPAEVDDLVAFLQSL